MFLTVLLASDRLAGLQRSLHPKIGRTRLLLFAADHGITKAKPSVSAFPREVWRQQRPTHAQQIFRKAQEG